jgi:hypothetical protein
VNDPRQESQPFRHVGTILSDSLLRGGGVSSEDGFDALGLGKQVSRVSKLRCLDGDHRREVKDIPLTEKVEPPRPPVAGGCGRGGGADGCPGIFCPRLGHKMETDQMGRSIVPEGLSWALNTSWMDPLRRTAANPDYGVVIECQLGGIPPSDKRSLCYHKP